MPKHSGVTRRRIGEIVVYRATVNDGRITDGLVGIVTHLNDDGTINVQILNGMHPLPIQVSAEDVVPA